jgi:hypothetical protein
MCQLFNQILQADGFQLVERTRLSGRPVYAGRFVGVVATRGMNKVRANTLQSISAFRHSSGLYTVQQSSEVATADRCRFARNST